MILLYVSLGAHVYHLKHLNVNHFVWTTKWASKWTNSNSLECHKLMHVFVPLFDWANTRHRGLVSASRLPICLPLSLASISSESIHSCTANQICANPLIGNRWGNWTSPNNVAVTITIDNSNIEFNYNLVLYGNWCAHQNKRCRHSTNNIRLRILSAVPYRKHGNCHYILLWSTQLAYRYWDFLFWYLTQLLIVKTVANIDFIHQNMNFIFQFCSVKTIKLWLIWYSLCVCMCVSI